MSPDPVDPNRHAIDIERLLEDLESSPEELIVPVEPVEQESGEAADVDLDSLLESVARPAAPPPRPQKAPIAATDLDDVFAQMRQEATGDLSAEAGEREYQRALLLRAAGDVDGCIEGLERASRAPSVRFVTASLLGRLLKERGQLAEALEWFERAVQAPAPTDAEYHAVMYELVVGLEETGEIARALAACLELQADAGSYRDVAVRAERLTRAQAEG